MQEKRKLLFKYITPSILSMVSIFLFTVIDGIFTGQGVGTDALGAVNIVFPFVMFHTAFIMMCTIGGMTITAIRIGRKDTDGANVSFIHSVSLCLCIGVVMSLIGTLLTEPLCRLLGANDAYIDMACDYMFWYAVFFIPCGLLEVFNGTVRNDSDPVLVSGAVITATIVNIFLDWLFIFPLHMGVKGAAIATGIAQCVGLLVVLTHFFRKKGVLRFKRCKFDMSLTRKIIVRGLPECINQFSIPITIIVMNLVIVEYIGNIGLNVFALISYVSSFALAVFLGVAEGIQPLFGRSYGEGNEQDLKYFLRWGITISFIGSAVIVGIVLLVCPFIYSLFGAEAETLEMTVDKTYLFVWGFLVESLNTIITAYLYSTTRTKAAVTINILRSFVVNIAVIIFVPAIFGAESIWLCLAIYEAIVLIVAIILLKHSDRKGAISGARE